MRYKKETKFLDKCFTSKIDKCFFIIMNCLKKCLSFSVNNISWMKAMMSLLYCFCHCMYYPLWPNMSFCLFTLKFEHVKIAFSSVIKIWYFQENLKVLIFEVIYVYANIFNPPDHPSCTLMSHWSPVYYILDLEISTTTTGAGFPHF